MKRTIGFIFDFDYDSENLTKLVDELFDVGLARGWDVETIALLVEGVQAKLARLTAGQKED